MSVRRSLVVITVLTLTVPFLAFAWRANQLRSADSNLNLQYYMVQTGSLQVAISAIGAVEAEAVARLSFTRPGRVTEVLAQGEDYVVAGDVLARQASDDEQIAYDRSLLSLQLAELQREDMLEPDEASIRIAEANLEAAWGAYLGLQNAVSPEDIQAAELRYQQALDAYDDAVRSRTTAPLGQPDEAYQILDAKVGEASFNAEIARLQLEALQGSNAGALNAAYARVIQVQKELERLRAGPTETQIAQAELAVEQAQATVDRALAALNDRVLIAPFDGIVSAVNLEAGMLGAPGITAIELTDVSPLHITVQVDEIDIRQIHEGMAAQIRLDALPGIHLMGSIERIALVGTSDQGIISYDVRVRLDTTDPHVRAGMTAEAAVVVERREDVLVVPNLYIRLDRERDLAFVNAVGADGNLKEIEITLGLRGQDASEVVFGLSVGDVIAINLTGGDRFSVFGG